MSSAERFRTFLAITPDNAVLDSIQQTAAELRRTLDMGGIRWELRSKWHITIRFLGDVPATAIPELSSSLAEVCGAQEVFSARASGLGVFPSLKRPRILWAGIESGGEHFAALHHALSSALDRFAAKPDEKRFRPHLTLARVRTEDRRELSRIATAVEPYSDSEFGTWEVTNVELWRSVLAPGGSQYELLTRAALRT